MMVFSLESRLQAVLRFDEKPAKAGTPAQDAPIMSTEQRRLSTLLSVLIVSSLSIVRLLPPGENSSP